MLAMTTVVIPAHNESQVIRRLLGQLAPATNSADFDIIVVANGCKDNTAALAAACGSSIRVLSIPTASKHAAVTAADAVTADFPRVYVDADVELTAADVDALVSALSQPGVLAAAPERVLDLTGRPWPVRWYYDVWNRLPEARCALWGRGVIAVNDAGQSRIAELPPLLGDDLAVSLLFAPPEQVIAAGARVRIHTPRTVGDLLRRKARSATGIDQLRYNEKLPSVRRTTLADLAAIAGAERRMIPRVALFLAIGMLARLTARRYVARADYSTWLRDESSRG